MSSKLFLFILSWFFNRFLFLLLLFLFCCCLCCCLGLRNPNTLSVLCTCVVVREVLVPSSPTAQTFSLPSLALFLLSFLKSGPKRGDLPGLPRYGLGEHFKAAAEDEGTFGEWLDELPFEVAGCGDRPAAQAPHALWRVGPLGGGGAPRRHRAPRSSAETQTGPRHY